MNMKITKIDRKWLEEHGACSEGKEWFLAQNILSPVEGVRNLLAKDKVDWANWLVVRLMSHTQQVRYAVYAAKQVLKLYEVKYPTDKRPRQAIAAALGFVDNPTEHNRIAAHGAANAAYAAAN